MTSIEFKSVFYFHPKGKPLKTGGLTITDAICDKVDGQAKPLVAVVYGFHAVTFTGVEGNDYVFKNTYGKHNAKNPAKIKIPKCNPPFNRIDLPYHKYLNFTFGCNFFMFGSLKFFNS